MSGPESLDPDSTRWTRPTRLADRHESGVALLVATWTAAFLVRSRLMQTERLSDVANEALLSLLFVVPIILVAWGALAVADRRFRLWSRDRR